MNEAHMREVESILLYISEARDRAARAHRILAADGAEPHLTHAVEALEARLQTEHRRLMQETFFAIPEQQKLSA